MKEYRALNPEVYPPRKALNTPPTSGALNPNSPQNYYYSHRSAALHCARDSAGTESHCIHAADDPETPVSIFPCTWVCIAALKSENCTPAGNSNTLASATHGLQEYSTD